VHACSRFGLPARATLLWRDLATGAHLSHVLAPESEQYDLAALTPEVLAEGGTRAPH
jgi:hypothetical protein